MVAPHTQLALFFWNEILGKTESDAWSDVTFKRQYLRHASSALKDGADIEILKFAMLDLRRDYESGKIDRIFSIQQALDWRKRGAKGMTYYQWAEAELNEQQIPPPIWDRFARMEWELKKEIVGGESVHRATENHRVHSAGAS